MEGEQVSRIADVEHGEEVLEQQLADPHRVGHPAGAVVVIAVVSLVGLLIGVVAVGDLRERRAAEAMRLQSSVTGALRRQAVELHLTLNVHVPFLRGSPAVIEVSGHVSAPEHRDIALGIVRAEVSRLRQDFVVEDRISISPR